MSHYESVPFTIVDVKGNMVTAQRPDKFITRNISFFKKFENQWDQPSNKLIKPKIRILSQHTTKKNYIEIFRQEKPENETMPMVDKFENEVVDSQDPERNNSEIDDNEQFDQEDSLEQTTVIEENP